MGIAKLTKAGDPFFLMLQYNNNVERNRQKKARKFYGRAFAIREYYLFLNFMKFRSLEFFKNLCAFSFSSAKSNH